MRGVVDTSFLQLKVGSSSTTTTNPPNCVYNSLPCDLQPINNNLLLNGSKRRCERFNLLNKPQKMSSHNTLDYKESLYHLYVRKISWLLREEWCYQQKWYEVVDTSFLQLEVGSTTATNPPNCVYNSLLCDLQPTNNNLLPNGFKRRCERFNLSNKPQKMNSPIPYTTKSRCT